ncbi:hypothetical protein ATK36_3416 [Amycolatopsis sulphurea]|uniref:Uncharacterized protein n=1 Tax=Amycolatopsis sulphurea TaxID=76022 RepID=A0A2A9FCQ4_9PSEU|nr:hypothetical protein ATK36_3416 [Amycolatopsis sulphurea]
MAACPAAATVNGPTAAERAAHRVRPVAECAGPRAAVCVVHLAEACAAHLVAGYAVRRVVACVARSVGHPATASAAASSAKACGVRAPRPAAPRCGWTAAVRSAAAGGAADGRRASAVRRRAGRAPASAVCRWPGAGGVHRRPDRPAGAGAAHRGPRGVAGRRAPRAGAAHRHAEDGPHARVVDPALCPTRAQSSTIPGPLSLWQRQLRVGGNGRMHPARPVLSPNGRVPPGSP